MGSMGKESWFSSPLDIGGDENSSVAGSSVRGNDSLIGLTGSVLVSTPIPNNVGCVCRKKVHVNYDNTSTTKIFPMLKVVRKHQKA